MTDHADRDYVLGTHDEEVARLGLQHRVWRPRVLDAWTRAGIVAGQTVLDIGAGPGFATADLADIVGPAGRVVAIERSKRFLHVLHAERARRNLTQIITHELDLDDADLPASGADAAWCRWVLAFVTRPEALLRKVIASLRPGGVLVMHEYLDYATWKLMPRVPSFEVFVSAVMAIWREQGGEPDIGRDLPRWCADAGADVISLRPIIDVVAPGDPIWAWPEAFLRTGLDRLVTLGRIDPARAEATMREFDTHKGQPGARMVTPLVIEVIARRHL
jgi:SAM-dependent methyltransferase